MFNASASELGWELRDTLRAWVVSTATVRRVSWPGEQRAAGFAQWLDRHVIDVALCEDARSAFEEISDVYVRVSRMIDRPQELEFVGPCQSDVEGVECDGVYAPRGADTRGCAECGVCVDVPSVMAATRAELETRLFTEAELPKALTVFLRRTIPRQTIRSWISSGRLASHGGLFHLAEAVELADKWKPKRKGARRA